MKERVAWVAEIPVPYRVGLYRRLREEGGLELKLFFCAATQADRDWNVTLNGVPHTVIRGATVGVKPREQFSLRANPGIWGELSRFRPDVVVVGGYAHLTMQWAMLWCRCHRVPYVINSESHHRRARGGLLRAMKRLPVRYFVSGAAAGLPTGSLAREYLISYGGRADRMFLLPNTCDVTRFSREREPTTACRDTVRRELGLGTGPVVLFVGRLTLAKGVDTLLRAFAALCADEGPAGVGSPRKSDDDRTVPRHAPDAPHLLIVGEGEQRAELEALAGALRIAARVRFAGSMPWEGLPLTYAAVDLFVLPSRFEPWGAVVNEALASGLPVIASDAVGCAQDLVQPGLNGWIVPAGDVSSLARVLREALADRERLAAMGAASARLAPEWGEEACLRSFMAAIRAVLE